MYARNRQPGAKPTVVGGKPITDELAAVSFEPTLKLSRLYKFPIYYKTYFMLFLDKRIIYWLSKILSVWDTNYRIITI